MRKIDCPAGLSRCLVLLVLSSFFFSLTMCGGGGGSTGGNADPPPEDAVTITGVVDDGSGNAPLRNARCRFVDMDGIELDADQSDATGTYRLYVPPEVGGYVLVNPQSAPRLTLSTVSSTHGLGLGSVKASEDVTPTTTVIADIIRSENPADTEGRKTELLTVIATQQDPDLVMVAALATRLYRGMLAREINTQFGSDSSDGGGDSDSDVDGGGQGDAGDGADFSPLEEATCEFVYGGTLKNGERCYTSALDDLLADGRLNRPDLAEVALEVLAGYDAQVLQQAFAAVFPHGVGAPVSTTTASDGSYFLPIPPNVSGFVRCTPKNQDKLVLGSYFPARQPGETIVDQDVTPATTVFSAVIASRLPEADLEAANENFLADIDGLDIQVQFDSSDSVNGFRLRPDTEPVNQAVGLVAFSATALFNAFNKNDLNVDFLAAIDDMAGNTVEDPASPIDSEFLADLGVPAEQTQNLATVVNTSIEDTADQLDTDLGAALSTGRLIVNVTDSRDGSPIENAMVDIEGSFDCGGCESQTGSNGEVLLTISGLSENATSIVVVVSGPPGYDDARVTATAASFATVDVDVRLVSDVVDTQNPSLTITAPSDALHETSSATIEIQGNASDDIGVVVVRWSNDRGGSGTCSGTTAWSGSGIRLQAGTNVIRLSASDAAGNTTSQSITVLYTPSDQDGYDCDLDGTFTYDGQSRLVLYFENSTCPSPCGPDSPTERWDIVINGDVMNWYDVDDGELDMIWHRTSNEAGGIQGVWEFTEPYNGQRYQAHFENGGTFFAYGNCN